MAKPSTNTNGTKRQSKRAAPRTSARSQASETPAAGEDKVEHREDQSDVGAMGRDDTGKGPTPAQVPTEDRDLIPRTGDTEGGDGDNVLSGATNRSEDREDPPEIAASRARRDAAESPGSPGVRRPDEAAPNEPDEDEDSPAAAPSPRRHGRDGRDRASLATATEDFERERIEREEEGGEEDDDQASSAASGDGKESKAKLGDIVYFYSKERRAGIRDGRPRVALVTEINEDKSLGLQVFDGTRSRYIAKVSSDTRLDEHWKPKK